MCRGLATVSFSFVYIDGFPKKVYFPITVTARKSTDLVEHMQFCVRWQKCDLVKVSDVVHWCHVAGCLRLNCIDIL